MQIIAVLLLIYAVLYSKYTFHTEALALISYLKAIFINC